MSEKAKLTAKQLRAIPILLAAKSYEKGCKAARISKTTFYTWMHDEAFSTEFKRRRDKIAAEAFGVLTQSLSRAVETLVGLLDKKDDRLKRLVAKDIIEHFLKHKENEELDKRLTEVEKRLAQEPRR